MTGTIVNLLVVVAVGGGVPTTIASGAAAGPVLLGRSERGRAIFMVQVGSTRGTRVMVFGCIHGSECAAARRQPHAATGATASPRRADAAAEARGPTHS